MNLRALSFRTGLLVLLAGLTVSLRSQNVSSQSSGREIMAAIFEHGKLQPQAVKLEVETFEAMSMNTMPKAIDNQKSAENELAFRVQGTEYPEGQAVIYLPREYPALSFSLGRFSLISKEPGGFIYVDLTGYSKNGRPVVPIFATNNDEIGISTNRLELSQLTSDAVLVLFPEPVSKLQLKVKGVSQGGQFHCAIDGLLSLKERILPVLRRDALPTGCQPVLFTAAVDISGSVDSQELETYFSYFPAAVYSTNSDGKIHQTEYYYPPDEGETTLINSHRISMPLRVVQKTGTSLGSLSQVGGTKMEYKTFSAPCQADCGGASYVDVYNPWKFYRWENGAWVLKKTHTKYDFTGLLEGVQKVGETAVTYNITNGLVYSKTWNNWQWVYSYFVDRQLEDITEPDGQLTAYSYDDLNRLQSITARGGAQLTNYTYTTGLPSGGDNKTRAAFTFSGLSSIPPVSEYYDGFGRQVSRVLEGHTPTSGNYIESTEYDALGRVDNRCIPSAGGCTYFYYEDNPLNRLYQQRAPGWIKKTETKYYFNTAADNVKKTATTYYVANSLYKTEGIDENGNSSYEFRDKLGRVVLSRRKISGTQFADTYYRYDDKGNLTYVIPPGAANEQDVLTFGRTSVETADNHLGGQDTYDYTYDMRDNVTDIYRTHTSPGVSKTIEKRYEYDHAGRLTGVFMKIDGGPEVQLSELEYDSKDRLIEKNLGPSGSNYLQSIDYAYNTRSWLARINTVIYGTQDPGCNNNSSSLLMGSSSYDEGLSATGELVFTYSPEAIAERKNTAIDIHYDIQLALEGFLLNSVSDNVEVAVEGREEYFGASFETEILQVSGRLSFGDIASAIAHSIRDKIQENNGPGNNPGFSQAQTAQLIGNIRQGLQAAAAAPPPPPSNPAPENDLFSENIYYTSGNSSVNATAQYNGNISYVKWRVTDRLIQTYGFQYDKLDRMTNAKFAEYDYENCGVYLNFDRYNVDLTYGDYRGNLSSIQRRGVNGGTTSNPTFGQIDNLSLVNEYNRLKNITESSLQGKGFNGSSGQYSYDNNGNLTADPSRGIASVAYNHLNLPTQITVSNSSAAGTIAFVYDADGNLLQRTVTQTYPSSSTTVTAYVNGIEYKNGSLEAIYHEEGRYVKQSGTWRHEYVLKDHLGNSRLFFSDINGNGFIEISEVTQEQHYYPYGMAMEGNWYSSISPESAYRYNGIEHTPELGLGVYNAFYRTLDPATARWWQVDPAAESFYGMTPYNAMGNSPAVYSDPQGDLPIIAELAGLTNGIRNVLQGDNLFDGFAQGWTQSWEITGGIFQWDGDLRFGQNLWNTISKLTWELPQTVVGLTVAQGLNVGTAVNDVNYFRGATVVDTDIQGGAFTLGAYLVGPEGFRPDFRDHLFVHEFGHYLQPKIVGPLYFNFVALPSVTDFNLVDELFGEDLHDTRWYESHASRLAVNYFDREFGRGAPGYFVNSPNHFDRNDFVNGTRTPYFNPRNGANRQGVNPINAVFHWSDIPINLIFNRGLGLFGFF